MVNAGSAKESDQCNLKLLIGPQRKSTGAALWLSLELFNGQPDTQTVSVGSTKYVAK